MNEADDDHTVAPDEETTAPALEGGVGELQPQHFQLTEDFVKDLVETHVLRTKGPLSSLHAPSSEALTYLTIALFGLRGLWCGLSEQFHSAEIVGSRLKKEISALEITIPMILNNLNNSRSQTTVNVPIIVNNSKINISKLAIADFEVVKYESDLPAVPTRDTATSSAIKSFEVLRDSLVDVQKYYGLILRVEGLFNSDILPKFASYIADALSSTMKSTNPRPCGRNP